MNIRQFGKLVNDPGKPSRVPWIGPSYKSSTEVAFAEYFRTGKLPRKLLVDSIVQSSSKSSSRQPSKPNILKPYTVVRKGRFICVDCKQLYEHKENVSLTCWHQMHRTCFIRNGKRCRCGKKSEVSGDLLTLVHSKLTIKDVAILILAYLPQQMI